MRAHTESKEEQIILSIGMIVKNEEKVLERCLKSLQPLMNAIPSELIIADTGSTDSTVEIAKKYTNNVFHFEWINDFAAARNSTLDKAQGLWYFFLDADEYLEDNAEAIVNFFKNSDNLFRYRTCQLTHRNYTDPEKNKYYDLIFGRFYRIKNVDEEVRFAGKIHEVMVMYPPIALIPAVIYHTGYCYETEEERRKKCNRNLKLLKEEYSNDPSNLRTLVHLIDSSAFEPEERKKYVEKTCITVKEHFREPYANSAYVMAMAYYYDTDIEKAMELSDEYLMQLNDSEMYIATLSVYYIRLLIILSQNEHQKIISFIDNYLKMYRDYKKNVLYMMDLSYHHLPGLSDNEYTKVCQNTLYLLLDNEKTEEVFWVIDQLDFKSYHDNAFLELVHVIKYICSKSRRTDKLIDYYRRIVDLDDPKKNVIIEDIIKLYYNSISDENESIEFAKAVVNINNTSELSELMKIVISQENPGFDRVMSKCFQNNSISPDYYSELLYLILKKDISCSSIINKIDPDFIDKTIHNIADFHNDFAGLVYKYNTDKQIYESCKSLLFFTTLYEVAASRSSELDDNKRYELCLKFTHLLKLYIKKVFNPDLLIDENDAEVLSDYYRFGYYVLCADSQLELGNALEYVRNLRKALSACKEMKEIVEFMLKQFRIKVHLS